MEMKSAEVVRNAAERQDFYGRIDKHSLAPLWEVLKGLIPDEPSPQMASAMCGWCLRLYASAIPHATG